MKNYLLVGSVRRKSNLGLSLTERGVRDGIGEIESITSRVAKQKRKTLVGVTLKNINFSLITRGSLVRIWGKVMWKIGKTRRDCNFAGVVLVFIGPAHARNIKG